jgi:glycolate oxidase iron-sulfur subunit
VHCGFCLPACPTYLATGDETESPRGRIVLMRGLARGELDPRDPAVTTHLDHCLGCRGCEPACPSGVGYGRGLELTRAELRKANGAPWLATAILTVFRRRWLWRPILTISRWLRATGIPARLAGSGRIGFAMGILAASAGADGGMGGWTQGRRGGGTEGRRAGGAEVEMFAGCVMSTLFAHVNAATERVLAANGHAVARPAGQGCCGALHAHAGDLEGARELARANVAAFRGTTGPIVVNSAGCGAMLKDYGHLLGDPEARAFAARVRDVSEILAADGPVAGAPLARRVAYDAPCHLQHAQGVHAEVLAVLRAIPELQVELAPGFDRCCGSAGIYSMLEPAMSADVLRPKVEALLAARCDAVATGNPGCLMQIGAGLRAERSATPAVHPVELLDASYRAAGLY